MGRAGQMIVIKFGIWSHRVRWEDDKYWKSDELDIVHYHRIYWRGTWTPFCRKEIQ